MTSCRQMRDAIVATVRRQASDADRLRLEQHLSVCAACRAEKARWLLMEQLGEQAPQRLPSDARARVLCHLTSLPEQEDAVGGKARRFLPLLLASTATVGVAFVLLAVRGRHDSAIGAAGRDDGDRLGWSAHRLSRERVLQRAAGRAPG
jgi:anti-sigma factor RsiW